MSSAACGRGGLRGASRSSAAAGATTRTCRCSTVTALLTLALALTLPLTRTRTFLLQMTDGSAYMMRASSAWERDLVTLSLRTFLTEYPPLDVQPLTLTLTLILT